MQIRRVHYVCERGDSLRRFPSSVGETKSFKNQNPQSENISYEEKLAVINIPVYNNKKHPKEILILDL